MITTEDRLRFSPTVRRALARYRLMRDAIGPRRDAQGIARSIDRLCAAARLAPAEATMRRIERKIHARIARLDPQWVDWSEFVGSVNDPRIRKAAILKPCLGPREKGVLFISFEDQWMKLLEHCDLRALAQRYTLVLSPTWCPPHALANSVFPAVFPDPVFTLISNPKDLVYLPRLSAKFVVVPLYASSWVNPEFYEPAPRDQRDIDIVMVANFGKYKRHHALFRALQQMRSKPRVVLIGQDQDGRTADTIRAEASLFGVDSSIGILANPSDEELADHLCRAKISLIVSRREGSCVVVAESLLADTPVGLLADAAIGSRAFIHASTGRLLDERHLAPQVEDFLAHAEAYSPRTWAVENISCFRSSHTLNEILKRHMHETGQDWTEDIAPLCWRPNPQLVHDHDRERMQPAWEELKAVFGVEIGPPALRHADCAVTA